MLNKAPASSVATDPLHFLAPRLLSDAALTWSAAPPAPPATPRSRPSQTCGPWHRLLQPRVACTLQLPAVAGMLRQRVHAMAQQGYCYTGHSQRGHSYQVAFERRPHEYTLLSRPADRTLQRELLGLLAQGWHLPAGGCEVVDDLCLWRLRRNTPLPAPTPVRGHHHTLVCRVDPPPDAAKAGIVAFRRSDEFDTSWFEGSTAGLRALRVSGSSQFSVPGLRLLRDQLPARHVVVVDLRQESHGFVDSLPISWYAPHNRGNRHKDLVKVEADEVHRLHKLGDRAADNHSLPLYWQRGHHLHKGHVRADRVMSEAALCAQHQLGYARLSMADGGERPPHATVEAFVRLVQSQPEGAWLHFHCLHGHGRTTFFMAMYDMWRNAERVSLTDILHRQHHLGGVDLRRHGHVTRHFLREFYAFCCACRRDPQMPSWQQWTAHKQRSTSWRGWLRAGWQRLW